MVSEPAGHQMILRDIKCRMLFPFFWRLSDKYVTDEKSLSKDSISKRNTIHKGKAICCEDNSGLNNQFLGVNLLSP